MAIVEISIVPIGVEGTSLSSYVAQAVAVLEKSGLRYEITGMGTIIHGELDEIWTVVRKMHESCLQAGAPRVLSQIRIDDRRDKAGSPKQKVHSVLQKLQSK